MSRKKILFLAHLFPWPLEGGGQIKSYHFLKILASEYDVTMLALARSDAEERNLGEVKALCAGGVRLIRLPRGKIRDLRIAARSLLTNDTFLVRRDEVDGMHHAVAQALDGERFAAIHVDHLQMASYIPADTRGAVVVLDEHNVEYRIPKRIAETRSRGIKQWGMQAFATWEWKRMREFESQAIRRADLTIAVSEEDRQSLQELTKQNAGNIITVPIGVDTATFGEVQWKPGSSTLVSIGTMYWPPNVDAILYFYREVYPKIRQQRPDVSLEIVGARPTKQIVDLASDSSVTVTGLVPDTRPYAERCGAFIVPLRSGSGMRVKILNAMAMGIPIVSTTVGAEGIDVANEENILLADTPEEFATAIVRVLSDGDLASRLATEGRRTANRLYSWEAVGERLLAAYRENLL